MKLMDVFVNSILRPKELVNVTIQTKDRFKRYLFFLSLLVTVMVFVIPVACRIISFGGFNKLFTETMPEISMNDGKLEADKRFEMNLGYADILIDTNLSEYKFEDFTTEGYFIAIGSDTTKFVRVGDKKDADSYSVIYAYSNAELFPNGFNNQFLVKCIPLIYIAFVFAFFLLAAITGLRYWFFAVVYAFLSRSLTAIIKVQITFKDAIHLCFYAQTIAILLINMNTAVGYMVYPTFASIIGVIITVVVIHKAVRPHMPSLDELMNNMKGNDFFK